MIRQSKHEAQVGSRAKIEANDTSPKNTNDPTHVNGI